MIIFISIKRSLSWWESGDEVTLITRPRRFGKTLNLSMVEIFFSVIYPQRSLSAPYPNGSDRPHILKAPGSDADLLHTGGNNLFQGLAIWEEEKYRRLQGTWPVIFLSFAKVKETSFLNARKIQPLSGTGINDKDYENP